MATKSKNPRVATPRAAKPKKAAFSFEGCVIEEAPYIEWSAFEDLPKGCILKGVVDYVEIRYGKLKAAVLLNGHTTSVTLWDTTLDDAKKLIGQPIKLKFKEMNDEGYPVLYVRY